MEIGQSMEPVPEFTRASSQIKDGKATGPSKLVGHGGAWWWWLPWSAQPEFKWHAADLLVSPNTAIISKPGPHLNVHH